MSKIMDDMLAEARREARLEVCIQDVREGLLTPQQALKHLDGMSLEEFEKEMNEWETIQEQEKQFKKEVVMDALKRGRRVAEIVAVLRLDVSLVNEAEQDWKRIQSRFNDLKSGRRCTPAFLAHTVGMKTADFLREMREWELQQEAKSCD